MTEKKPGDLKTEVHFIGQVVGGSDFNFDNVGLFCEIQLEYGEHWFELPSASDVNIQTQTSYADADALAVWAHPLDLHFSTESIFGWPKLLLRVWRLDDVGRIDLVSYGVCALPTNSGFYNLECPTWRPIGSWNDEAMTFFVGNPPRLTGTAALSKSFNERELLKTVSAGIVHIELEVLLRNFDPHSTSGSVFARHIDLPFSSDYA